MVSNERGNARVVIELTAASSYWAAIQQPLISISWRLGGRGQRTPTSQSGHRSAVFALLYDLGRVKKEDEAVRTVSVILACLALCACATSPSDDDQDQDYQYIPSSTPSARGAMLFDAETVRESPLSNAFSNALKSPAYMDDGDKPNIQRLSNLRFFSVGPGFAP